MKLRELINRLEYLSNNGKFDELDVEVFDSYMSYNANGNDVCEPINSVFIDRYISDNDEYNYIQIKI